MRDTHEQAEEMINNPAFQEYLKNKRSEVNPKSLMVNSLTQDNPKSLSVGTLLKDREKDYGKPIVNFTDIATCWSMYTGKNLTPSDVANMMLLLKICRAKNGEYKEDTFMDIIGYATLANGFKKEGV